MELLRLTMRLLNLHTFAMKSADKVTTLRIILAPVFFVVFNFYEFFSVSRDLAVPGFLPYWQVPVLWVIFAVAELSDMFDGMLARSRGEVSGFGKLFDPFADTLFQITLFFCFVGHGILPAAPFLLILYREFAIQFVRNLMQKKGISMGARMGGKIKTVVSIASGILALAAYSLEILIPWLEETGRFGLYGEFHPLFSRSAVLIFYAAVVLSILSFVDYVRVYLKSSDQ